MVFKIVHVILLASVKYIITLPYAMLIGLDYPQAVVSVLLGGIGGFLFFYYLSKHMIKGFEKIRPGICNLIPKSVKQKYNLFCERLSDRKPKKIFSKRSRFIIKVRTNYGFWGIIIATPVVLTIPVGAFLANKYYAKRPQTVPYMILSIVSWAGVLSGIVHIFPNIFF